ncbi:DNA processing protein DprA, partial [Mycolicibacterium insubricum]|nr:DNA processing protein DprA [Mycolicibacterium insubricum]
MSAETTRRAWAYLSRVAEPPCTPLRELVAAEGPVVAARMIWQHKEPAELTALVAGRRGVDRSAADLEFLAGRGGRLLTPDDEEWPYLAFQSFDSAVAEPTREAVAPLVLWVLGPARLDEVAERAVAIVGTPSLHRLRRHPGRRFRRGDSSTPIWRWCPGAAYGDRRRRAPQCAGLAPGVTVAVLAAGLDVPYRPAIRLCC